MGSSPSWSDSWYKEHAEHLECLRAQARRKAELAAAIKPAGLAEVAAHETALRIRSKVTQAQIAREAARGPGERAARSAAHQVGGSLDCCRLYP